jgi:integrase
MVKVNPFAVERSTRWRRPVEKRPTLAVPFEKVEEMLERPSRHTTEGKRDRAILALLFGGGLRRSEVTRLRLRDLQKSVSGQRYILLRDTKTSPLVEHALPDWVLDTIDVWIIERERLAPSTDFLFPSPQTAGDKISDSSVYFLFRKYLREVGLSAKDYSPHSARATAITKLLSDGVGHREVQEFSRHASVSMVEWYDKRFLGIDKSPAKGLSFSLAAKKKKV